MTGDEHYRAANELMTEVAYLVAEFPRGGPAADDMSWIGLLLASAQVHSTLALAAATAAGTSLSGYGRSS